ncbi:hypothetical protein [Euzebya pacifica]|nr:hypothetical protein [Euzebya pacifica]
MSDPITADITAILAGDRPSEEAVRVVVAALGADASLAQEYSAGCQDAADLLAALILPVLTGDLLTTRAMLRRGRVATDPGRTAAMIAGLPGPATHPAGTKGWFTSLARTLLDSAVPHTA